MASISANPPAAPEIYNVQVQDTTGQFAAAASDRVFFNAHEANSFGKSLLNDWVARNGVQGLPVKDHQSGDGLNVQESYSEGLGVWEANLENNSIKINVTKSDLPTNPAAFAPPIETEIPGAQPLPEDAPAAPPAPVSAPAATPAPPSEQSVSLAASEHNPSTATATPVRSAEPSPMPGTLPPYSEETSSARKRKDRDSLGGPAEVQAARAPRTDKRLKENGDGVGAPTPSPGTGTPASLPTPPPAQIRKRRAAAPLAPFPPTGHVPDFANLQVWNWTIKGIGETLELATLGCHAECKLRVINVLTAKALMIRSFLSAHDLNFIEISHNFGVNKAAQVCAEMRKIAENKPSKIRFYIGKPEYRCTIFYDELSEDEIREGTVWIKRGNNEIRQKVNLRNRPVVQVEQTVNAGTPATTAPGTRVGSAVGTPAPQIPPAPAQQQQQGPETQLPQSQLQPPNVPLAPVLPITTATSPVPPTSAPTPISAQTPAPVSAHVSPSAAPVAPVAHMPTSLPVSLPAGLSGAAPQAPMAPVPHMGHFTPSPQISSVPQMSPTPPAQMGLGMGSAPQPQVQQQQQQQQHQQQHQQQQQQQQPQLQQEIQQQTQPELQAQVQQQMQPEMQQEIQAQPQMQLHSQGQQQPQAQLGMGMDMGMNISSSPQPVDMAQMVPHLSPQQQQQMQQMQQMQVPQTSTAPMAPAAPVAPVAPQ